jgi:hypothetical protein
MRFRAILFSFVAGAGHIYLGRHVQGVAFFALFAGALNGLLISSFWQGEEAAWWIRVVSGSAALLVFALAMASILGLTLFTDREALRKCRDEALRRGLVHYLRDELVQADRAFREALRCDVDRRDADVLFHLGAVACRLGEERRARRLFRHCLGCDPSEKWRAEVARELARTKAAPRVHPRGSGRLPLASGRLPIAAPAAAAEVRP